MTAAFRIVYESSSLVERDGAWISERELFARRGRFGVDDTHVSDAELRVPGGRAATAIEVELHRKQPASRYVDEVFARLPGDVTTVVYLCPRPLLTPLRNSVLAAVIKSGVESRVAVRVVPLPELVQARVDRGLS